MSVSRLLLYETADVYIYFIAINIYVQLLY